MQEQLLGDYRIIKQIGQGTLGAVLLVEHRFIKKPYVLKVLPQELCQDRGFIERFEEEVAKLAALDHPHIVKIHNVSFAEGRYFLVSDCVVDSIGETTNLAQYMSGRKERLREEELLSTMGQIADALDYAHTKGQIAHRSLKLNNILIGKGNPGIEVFISDFGLSKVVSAGKVVCRTFMTLAEALQALPVEKGREERYSPLPVDAEKFSKLSYSFLQTYAFLAPEQKRFELVGMQADTYAFGVLAYYLITGIFPEGAFELPSKVAPEYSAQWDELVRRCLQPDPVMRPSQLKLLMQEITPSAALSPPASFPPPQEVSLREEVAPLFRAPVALAAEEADPARIMQEVSPPVETKIAQPYPVERLEEIPADIPEECMAMAQVEGHQEKVAPRLSPEMALHPVINRTPSLAPPVESELATVEVVRVASKDVSEATSPLPHAPLDDISYSAALHAIRNRDPVVTQYQPEVAELKHIEPLQTEMVVIQGGECIRGSQEGNRDEMPQHKIWVSSFAIDIHPVTNEQFVRFLEYMGGEKDQNYNDLIRLKSSRISRSGGRLSIESGYAKHPVVGVTWYGAVAYTKWVGKRLPTEAEWEVAARGGSESPLYPTGKNIEKNQANFFSSDTTKVMSYVPNGYGLYDMAGNVYEWCQDWYGYNYYETSKQEPYDPPGPVQGVYRVLRGGCWKSLKEDLRVSHRHRNNPGTVNSTYGFRCAAYVQ